MSDQIRGWAEAHREELARDLMRLIRIPSVSESRPDLPYAPYGEDCDRVLGEALALCGEYGFETKNLTHCGLARLPGAGAETIGIFGHLDVVPAGSGWVTGPYEPVEDRGYIVGRGAKDNKGPTVGALYAMRCLKELSVTLEHSVQLYLGCNEEAGMADVEYFTANYPQPAFSLVPDVSFPVCCGEKGVLTADLVRPIADSNLLGFRGGVASNSVPDHAWAVISGSSLEAVKAAAAGWEDLTVEGVPEGIKITARGVAGHIAFPEGTRSAIQDLAEFLHQNSFVTGDGGPAMAFLAEAFADSYGHGLDIGFEDDISGKTTHGGGMARLEEGRLIQNINVRYIVHADQDELLRRLRARCLRSGFTVENLDNNQGYYTPLEHPAIAAMMGEYARVYGEGAQPYVMGGGTYARKLKNAVGFGPGVPDPDSPFGGGHQPNEGVKIDYLINMVDIYANTLIAIDPLV